MNKNVQVQKHPMEVYLWSISETGIMWRMTPAIMMAMCSLYDDLAQDLADHKIQLPILSATSEEEAIDGRKLYEEAVKYEGMDDLCARIFSWSPYDPMRSMDLGTARDSEIARKVKLINMMINVLTE